MAKATLFVVSDHAAYHDPYETDIAALLAATIDQAETA